MKSLLAGLALSLVIAAPALADLKPGATAPDFSAPAYLSGKPFTFKLSNALKKGPVVLYFFPSAFTKGCNLEARMFSEAIDEFKAQGATVIGVTAGKTDKLAEFSKDTETCAGKFAVASDPDARIAKTFDAPLKVANLSIPANLSARTTYVIAPSGKVVFAYDSLDASEHVSKSLAALKTWKGAKGK